MHRSASTGHVRYYHYHHRRRHSDEVDLPMYDPFSNAAKKEKAVARFAVNAVHVIPFVLLFCAFLLWLFSHPTDIEVKENMFVAKINGLRDTIKADIDSDGIGHFPLDLTFGHSKTLISKK